MTNIKTIDPAHLESVLGGASKGINCDGPPPDAWFGNFRWWLGDKMGLHRGCPKKPEPSGEK